MESDSDDHSEVNETAIKTGFGLVVLQDMGFEPAPASCLLPKMRGISPDASTAMRDSVMQGTRMMLNLYQTLSACNIAHVWNFVHIVLTDGGDNASKASLEETSLLLALIGQTIPVKMLKTGFIGVELESDRNASAGIATLVRSGGENTEFASISDANIEKIFSQLTLSLGLIKRTEIQGIISGDQAVLSVKEQEIALLSLEQQHYVVLFNLDMSGSMGSRWNRVIQSVNEFLRYLGPQDLVAGLAFNTEVKLLTAPRVSASQMIAAMMADPLYQAQQLGAAFRQLSARYNTSKHRQIDMRVLIRPKRGHCILKKAELRNVPNQNPDSDVAIKDPIEYLGKGKRLSEDFKIKLQMWKDRQQTVLLKDNFVIQASQAILDPLSTEKIIVSEIADQFYYCDICKRNFTHKQSHDSQFLKTYISVLNETKMPELSEFLSNLVGKETWNWTPVKAIEKPDYLIKLDDISEKMKTDLNELKKIVPLVENGIDDEWLVYFKNTPNKNLIKNVANAATTNPISFTTTGNQDQKNTIKAAIDTPVQIEKKKSDFFKSESSRRTTYGDIQLMKPENGFIDSNRVPKVKIQAPPQWKPDNERNLCALCNGAFTFIHRRHHCRSCGDIFCGVCILDSIILKHGYLFPVKVCKVCHEKMSLDDSFLWIEHAKDLASEGFEEDAGKALLISSCYKADTKNINSKLLQAGDAFYKEDKYKLALECYSLINIDFEKWMKLAQDFCEKEELVMALTSIRNAKTSHKKSNNQLVFYGDEYVKSALKSAEFPSEKYPLNEILSLYYYLEGNLKIQDVITKNASHEHTGKYALCSFYLAYASAKKLSLQEWTQLGETMMNAQNYRTALYCYYDSRLPIDKWVDMIERFCSKLPPNYETAARLLDSVEKLYQPTWNQIKIKSDFTQYIIWIKECSPNISFDSMLDRYLGLVRQKSATSKIDLCILFATLFGKCSKLNEESNKYLSKKDFPKAFICFGLSKSLEDKTQSWTEYGELLLEIDLLNAFLCFTMENPDWKKLGDSMFVKGNYTAALDCFVRSKNNDIHNHIRDRAQEVMQKYTDKAFIYYAQLYKNGKFVIETVQKICEAYPKAPIKDITIAALQKYSNNYDDISLAPLHETIGSILQAENRSNSIKAAVGALHYSGKHNSTSCNAVPKLNQWLIEQESEGFYQILKNTIKESKPKEIANLVFKLDDVKVEGAKSIYRELVGDQDIAQMPAQEKPSLYLVRASIKIYEKEFASALIDLKTVLVCNPLDEIPEAVAIMLQNENLLVNTYHTTCSEMTDMVKSGFKELNTFCDIKIPEDNHHQELFKGSPILDQIRQFEKAVNTKSSQNSVESAFFYLDFCPELEDASSLAGCFIMAGLHFLNAQTKTSNGDERYAYRNAIVEMMLNAYIISINHLTPSMQIYMNRVALAAILQANQSLAQSADLKAADQMFQNTENLIDSQNVKVIQGLVTNILRKSRVAPISKNPTSFSCDTVCFDLACRSYTQSYLNAVTKKGNPLCPPYLADYYLFEGAWRQWFGPELDSDEARSNSMKSLLETKKWKLEDVQRVMDWPAVQRTSEGWLDPKPSKLNFYTKSFSKVIGVQMRIETGNISFLLQEGTESENLFTCLDIYNILVFGIKGAFFTLDHPDPTMPAHPFQEIKYYPKEIANTDYLATLFHTDYLLKMMSTGVEVSAAIPFKMKRASTRFMKKLPEHLQEALKPISDRDNSGTCSSETAHRFWIEAGELKFSSKETDGVITYLFGDLNMKVKQGLMMHNSKGKLVEVKDDDSNDTSPEAEFARAFTKHYDEVGKYLPEFLRLKELLKLSAMCACIQKTHNELKGIIDNMNIDLNEIRTALNQIKSQVKYPQNTSYKIDELFSDVLRQNGIYNEYNVDYSTKNKIKQEIGTSLKEADEKVLNEVTKILGEAFHTTAYLIKSEVDKWLRGSYNNLVDSLASSAKQFQVAKVSKIVNEVNALNFSTESIQDVEIEPNEECAWVPAALACHDEALRIHGGISLGLSLSKDDKKVATNYKTYNARDIIKSANDSSANTNFPRMNGSTFTGKKDVISNNHSRYSNPGKLDGRSGTFELGVKTYKTSQGNTVNLVTQRVFRSEYN